MEPETPHPWPFFLLFLCLPKNEKTNKTMLLDRGCFTLGWGLPGCPAPMLLLWVVIKSVRSGLWGWMGPVGLRCFPLLYLSTPTKLSLVGIYAQLQTSRAS